MKFNGSKIIGTLLIFTSLSLAVNVKGIDASIKIYPKVPTEGITISANGSVGIKTINPRSDLDVNGSAYISSGLTVNGGTSLNTLAASNSSILGTLGVLRPPSARLSPKI